MHSLRSPKPMELIPGNPENNRDTFSAGAAAADDPHSLLSSHHSLRRPPLPSPGSVRRRAYRFDGQGGFYPRDWDLADASDASSTSFDWFHVDLPKGNHKLSVSAQLLIDALCPPLKLQDILSLVSNGPLCAHVDGALIFRVNSPGPATSDFTLRLAARVTEASVITVSLGRVPRLGFSVSPLGQSLLSEIPVAEHSRVDEDEEEGVRGSGIVIREHVLEFLLTMNHSEEADNPVPSTVSDLVVHIIDTHVDHVQDIVTRLEMELDAIELELDKGGSALKKQMLDDRRFPKMHLDLQRLLQVVSHGEQVFPRVKEKCAGKAWFLIENIAALEELIGRLRRLKENLGFIVNRVTAIQAGLDSWQAEQINRKLYYLSFFSLIFLPLSIVTGGKLNDIYMLRLRDLFAHSTFLAVFGMNVGGVPWTGQKDPELKDGFRNVLLLCAVMLMLLLLCFTFPTIYAHISAWRRRAALKRSWSLNRKSFLKRTLRRGAFEGGGGYIRL